MAGAYGYYLYVSTNSGIDWTNRILGQYWGPVFCSADGKIMAAAGGRWSVSFYFLEFWRVVVSGYQFAGIDLVVLGRINKWKRPDIVGERRTTFHVNKHRRVLGLQQLAKR